MQIAFITPEFVTESYFSGGLANYLNRITQALAAAGNDVHIVTLSDVDDDNKNNGVYVHRIKTKYPSRWFNILTLNRLNQTGRNLKFSYLAFCKLRQLHREKAFDLVQSPNFFAIGLFTLLFLHIPHVTRISSYRPLWYNMSGVTESIDTKMVEWFEKLNLRLCRHIYAPSFTLQRILNKEASIKCEVIRTPIFIENSNYDQSIYEHKLKGKDYLLFFGRLQMHKGVHILGQALPDVFAGLPDIYVVFAGEDRASSLGPSMREYIKQQCKGYCDRLIFIDALYHKQLYPVIKGSKFVVLPSLTDNLPNTMLESMALGKPVLGTIGCSFDEVIEEGKNGFLIKPGDPKALAQKIIEIYQRRDLDKIGKAASIKMQEHSTDTIVPKLVDYYQEVIKTKNI
jgi:glycosyltransferase involved in cell wall biosynthesis